MTKKINNYGKYAGKVWQTLDSCGPQTQNKIIKKTKLDENDFWTAIGWLAKENKILKTGNKFHLGETNLDKKIGKNAGKIWDTLNQIGYVDEPYLPKLSGVPNKDAYAAIGWLAREGKINIKRTKPKKPQTKYGLKK